MKPISPIEQFLPLKLSIGSSCVSDANPKSFNFTSSFEKIREDIFRLDNAVYNNFFIAFDVSFQDLSEVSSHFFSDNGFPAELRSCMTSKKSLQDSGRSIT